MMSSTFSSGPSHTHDKRHSSKLMEMHMAYSQETQPQQQPSSDSSSKRDRLAEKDDASSIFSNSSFSSKRHLLRSGKKSS
ncbi:hypothetical protein TruAng_005133 [Truncatella angustata]|nr:hypothetical protein TruAng_005133 [Truncatella angustata]